MNKQEKRSEETKRLILEATGKLFSQKGYDTVTMREFAKKANCSHTTIYLYYKDKETLLYQLCLPSLVELKRKFQSIQQEYSLSAKEKLKKISREYIQFCLRNRNMYTVFMNAKSSRVDEDEPQLEINRLRIDLFKMLMSSVQQYLQIEDKEDELAYARIFYYSLNGIVHTYSYEHEPYYVTMERLTPTFDLAVDVLLLGFKEKVRRDHCEN